MPVIIAMLRGVNVGGHNKLPMDALRALCASLRLQGACTYVQSGNVVFRTDERDLARLAKRVQDAVAHKFGFRPEVILRTTAEMRVAIARNPFAKRRGIEPAKLLVTFLAGEPAADARKKVLSATAGAEELHLAGRELYIYFPNGAGQSKLPWASLAGALKTQGTARNWNTVQKLLEMAEKLEAAS